MIVSLTELSEGAIVRTDILDGRGRMLVPAGTILSAPLLETMQERNVLLVDILVAEDASNAIGEQEKERTRILELFANSPRSTELSQLQRALLEVLGG